MTIVHVILNGFNSLCFNSSDLTNITSGGTEVVCELFALPAVAILSALLIITILIVVMIIAVFTVVTIKLSRKRAIPQQHHRKTGRELATCTVDYEDIDTHRSSDMNINENAAYCTINDL